MLLVQTSVMWQCLTQRKFGVRQTCLEAIAFLFVPVHCVPVGPRHFTLRLAAIFNISELRHPSPDPSEKVFSSLSSDVSLMGVVPASLCRPLLSISATISPCFETFLGLSRSFFPVLQDQLVPGKRRKSCSSKGFHLIVTIYLHAFSLSFLPKKQSSIMLEASKNLGLLVVGTKSEHPLSLGQWQVKRQGIAS